MIKDLLKTNEMDFERTIHLSEEADLQSEIYNQQIERRLTDDLEQIEEWAGKLHGNTMRIAAIFHIVKYGWDAVNVPLEAETLAGAIKVGQYYLEHSMAAFDMPATDMTVKLFRAMSKASWDQVRRLYLVAFAGMFADQQPEPEPYRDRTLVMLMHLEDQEAWKKIYTMVKVLTDEVFE